MLVAIGVGCLAFGIGLVIAPSWSFGLTLLVMSVVFSGGGPGSSTRRPGWCVLGAQHGEFNLT
ncbi:MAG: hypothetical protein JO362_00755 [Streptomycetaceae bacterium]|nr:hypothetical protein [Streptomycetaceae bacterium]